MPIERAGLRHRGWTLLEVIVVVCLVGILASLALERMLRYQELAEKTAMEGTLGALRSALALQATARIMHGRFDAVGALAEEDPMSWLADRPIDYIGARHGPTLAELPKGSWCFDLDRKELIYRPLRTRFFSASPGAGDWIRFKVVVRLAGPGKDRPFREISELGIHPTSAVQWSPEF